MAVIGQFRASALAMARRQVFKNAASLYGSTVITSAMGFLYWLVAARLFPIHSVGVASAAISAMLLLGEFGILGLSTLLIAELASEDYPRGLVSAASGVAFVASGVLGLGYVLFQHVASTRLGALGLGFFGPVVFTVGVAVTGLTFVLDAATVGINRGDLQLWRNAVFSFSKLVVLAIVAPLALGDQSVVIYAAWLAGNAVSIFTFWVHLRRTGIRPVLRPALAKLIDARAAAFAHHWLNLAAQAPRLVLPVLVTVTLSPTLNAGYYDASLVVSFVSIIPSQLATALFALPRGQLHRLGIELRSTLRLSVAVGAASAVLFAVVAHPVLSVFGAGYARAASAMAVLGLSTIPFAVKMHYAAVERVRGRLMLAALVSTVGGLLEIVLAYLGARAFGLVGVAEGLVLGLSIEAFALWPTVARAAGVHPYGSPAWLWRRDLDGDAAATGSRTKAGGGQTLLLRPGDPLFVRLHASREALRRRRWPIRLLAVPGLSLTWLRIAQISRRIPQEQVSLGHGEAGRALRELVTTAAGPWTMPLPLLSVLDLPQAPGAGLPTRQSRQILAAAAEGVLVTQLQGAPVAIGAYAACRGLSPDELVESDPEILPLLRNPEVLVLSAGDDRNVLRSIAVCLRDREEAYLARLVTVSERSHAWAGTRAVHAGLVGLIVHQGVRRLWAPAPMGLDLRQQVLMAEEGYVCRSLRLAEPEE